jgi:predicted DNA-binding transcriptional regulator AlpA
MSNKDVRMEKPQANIPRSNLLDERDVARMTRMSLSTVRHWRFYGKRPKYLKIGSSVRHRMRDITRFLASLPTAGGKPLNA